MEHSARLQVLTPLHSSARHESLSLYIHTHIHMYLGLIAVWFGLILYMINVILKPEPNVYSFVSVRFISFKTSKMLFIVTFF